MPAAVALIDMHGYSCREVIQLFHRVTDQNHMNESTPLSRMKEVLLTFLKQFMQTDSMVVASGSGSSAVNSRNNG